jgi:hypothetical protein
MKEEVVHGSIYVYWLPLGAGGPAVRWKARVYEALVSIHEHRPARVLSLAALDVRPDEDRYVIEMALVRNLAACDRSVVCEGPVAAKWLGGYWLFRYGVQCWLDGYIPDAAEAVNSPQRVSDEPRRAASLVDVLRSVPPLTWGP